MGYRGPTGIHLTEDQWYIIYLTLLSNSNPAVTQIRGLIHEFLSLRGHPGLADEPDR